MFSIQNNTRAEIACSVMMLQSDSSHLFHLIPTQLSLPPLKKSIVRVVFRPVANGTVEDVVVVACGSGDIARVKVTGVGGSLFQCFSENLDFGLCDPNSTQTRQLRLFSASSKRAPSVVMFSTTSELSMTPSPSHSSVDVCGASGRGTVARCSLNGANSKWEALYTVTFNATLTGARNERVTILCEDSATMTLEVLSTVGMGIQLPCQRVFAFPITQCYSTAIIRIPLQNRSATLHQFNVLLAGPLLDGVGKQVQDKDAPPFSISCADVPVGSGLRKAQFEAKSRPETGSNAHDFSYLHYSRCF